jgi:hypothetical protein
MSRVGPLTPHETRHLGKLSGGVVVRTRAVDLRPPSVRIGCRDQLGNRHMHAVGVGHVLAPVGKGDFERFREQVDVAWLAEPQAVLADREGGQQVEHLQDVRPAGRRRRRRQDVVPTILAANWVPLLHAVARQVV